MLAQHAGVLGADAAFVPGPFTPVSPATTLNFVSLGQDIRYQAYISGISATGPAVVSIRIVDSILGVIAGASQTFPTGELGSMSLVSQRFAVPAAARSVSLEIEISGSNFAINAASDSSHQGATIIADELAT